jgi:pSer/pThr/pTyr-binding forkhead associated (FHA) protein
VDPTLLAIWVIRLLFLGLLYLFLWIVVRVLLRDLRAAAREPVREIGRLVVLESPSAEPPVGAAFRLDAVTTLGRDVNNAIVLEDDFASAGHAALTYRGRAWYLEDFDSTNGTFVNGHRVEGVVAVAFGDELQIGQVRLRLERPRDS